MSYNLEQANSGFASYSSAALAIGTNTGTFKTTATLTYTSNGLFKSKSATDNLAFSTGHTALGNSQACLFGVWIDASGNVTTSQGPIVAAGDPCPVPTAPASNLTFVGYIKVSTSSSQTFTPGTSVLGTGNTAVYANCARVPGTAQ
jgi:hypothetical protein